MRTPWRGIIAPIGQRSIDGRTLHDDPTDTVYNWTSYPLPLLAPGVGTVGRVDKLWREGTNLWGNGSTDWAPLQARLITQGWFTGGIELGEHTIVDDPDGGTVFMDWSVRSFTVHDQPAWPVTRLEYA